MTDDEDALSSFANKFIVEKQLVKDHLVHLNALERNFRSKDRLQKRQEMRNKQLLRTMIGTVCVLREKFKNSMSES